MVPRFIITDLRFVPKHLVSLFTINGKDSEHRTHKIKAHSLGKDKESVRAQRVSFFWTVNSIRNVIKMKKPTSINQTFGR